MKHMILPTAALIATALAAPAFASNFQSDRGYADLRSYEVTTTQAPQAQTIATKSEMKVTQDKAAKEFNRKFGSPHPNFESGRR